MRVAEGSLLIMDRPDCQFDTSGREHAKDMHYSSTCDFRSMQARGHSGRGGQGLRLVAGFGE